MNIKEVQRANELKAAQRIIETVEAENRDLTTKEQAAINGHLETIKGIDEQSKKSKAAKGAFDDFSKSFAYPEGYVEDSEQFDTTEVKSGLVKSLSRKSPYAFNLPVNTKAATTAGALDLPGTGNLVSESLPGTTMVALRDIFAPQRTDSGNVRYYRMGSGTAEVVAEGGLKPDAGITIEPVDDVLKKVATTFGFTDELVEDANFLVGYIKAEALRGVLKKENVLVIEALESAEGAMTATGTAAAIIDVLAQAIGATTATNGVAPTQVLINPLDLAKIRVTKGTGSGDYAIDPLSAGPTTIHGVNVLATPAVPQGTVYIVSAGAGVFYTRQDSVRVDVGYSSDDWVHNKLTGRAEERVLPAVIRPSLITKVTLTA